MGDLATFKEMHRILFMTATQFFEYDSVRICALIRKSRISGSPQRFGKAGRSGFRELSTTERSWREMLLAWLLCRCSMQCVVHTQRQLCGFSSRALLLDREGAASYKFGSVVIYAVRYPFPSQIIFVRIFRSSFFPRSPQVVRLNWVPSPVTIDALL